MLCPTWLFLSLAFVALFSASSVGTVVVLANSTEVAGMLGPALGGSRRVDGPMGKADRGFALGILGLWICCGGPLPSEATWATLRLDACSRSLPPIGCISRGPRGSGPADDGWLLGSRIAPSAAVAPQRPH